MAVPTGASLGPETNDGRTAKSITQEKDYQDDEIIDLLEEADNIQEGDRSPSC